jgi:hypothetical protein
MTNYMQPINPIRVWQRGDEANYCHPVFAMAVVDVKSVPEVEYLTINGLFMRKRNIMYAEVLLEGVWTSIKEHRYAQIDPH